MSFPTKDLNEVQLKAVKSDGKRILVLAGAGSGKTRTLIYRLAYLMQEKKTDPSKILAVTFTNKAAREMKERLEQLVKTNLTKLWIGTFHSMFARILRMESDAHELDRYFTIYDTDDQVNTIKRAMSALNIPQQLHPPKLFQARISQAKNRMLFPDDLEENAHEGFEALLPDVYRKYNEILKETLKKL